jgi:hypothetical protein
MPVTPSPTFPTTKSVVKSRVFNKTVRQASPRVGPRYNAGYKAIGNPQLPASLNRGQKSMAVPKNRPSGGMGRPKITRERDSDGTTNTYREPSIPKSTEHINRIQAAARHKLARKAGGLGV